MSLDAKRLSFIEQLAYFQGVSDAEVILTGSQLRLIRVQEVFELIRNTRRKTQTKSLQVASMIRRLHVVALLRRAVQQRTTRLLWSESAVWGLRKLPTLAVLIDDYANRG